MNKALSPGIVFDNRFVILDALGAGGMGTVYKAQQIGLERIVALKILNSALVDSDDSEARFQREAKILSLLAHKNIASFYQYGVAENLPFIAMEFVSGNSLRQILQGTGSISWKRICDIALQICNALSYAHEHGIIHRDLKPENIILSGDESSPKVTLIDFGLSKIIDPQMEEIQKLTRTGDLIGSINYLSPELCKGLKPDSRADIYALGVILYEMVSGHPPFAADSPVGVVYKHSNEMPAALTSTISELPVQLEQVILKCLAKAPDDRYQTASALSENLKHLIEGSFDKIEIDQPIHKKAIGARAPFLILTGLLIAAIAAASFAWKMQTTENTNTFETKKRTQPSSKLGNSPDVKLSKLFPLYRRTGRIEEAKKGIAEIESLLPQLKARRDCLYVAYFMQGYFYNILQNRIQAIRAYSNSVQQCKESDGRLAVNAIYPLVELATIYSNPSMKKLRLQTLLEANKILEKNKWDETYPALNLSEVLHEMPREDAILAISQMLAELYGEERKFALAEKFRMEARSKAQDDPYNAAGVIKSDLQKAKFLEMQGQTENARAFVDSIDLDHVTHEGIVDGWKAERVREACYLLGIWYKDHDDKQKARYWLKQATSILGPFPPDSSLGTVTKNALAEVTQLGGNAPELKLARTFQLRWQDGMYNEKKKAIAEIDSLLPGLQGRKGSLFVAEYMKGILLNSIDKEAESTKAFANALQLSKEPDAKLTGNSVHPLVHLAQNHVSQSRTEEALPLLLEAERILQEQDKGESLPVLDIPNSLEEMPKDDVDYLVPNMLATIYAKKGKFKIADQYSLQAKKNAQRSFNAAAVAESEIQRATALEKQGQKEKARALVDSLTVLPEGQDSTWRAERARQACYIIGRWYAEHQAKEKARAWFIKAGVICGPFPPDSSLGNTIKAALANLDKTP